MYTARAAMAVVSAPLLLLALLAGGSSPIIPAAAANNGEDDGYTLVALSSLKPKDGACFGHRVNPPAQNGTSWVPTSLLYGPCSGSGSDDDTASPSFLADLLRQDQLRVDDILRRLSGNNASDEKPTHKAPYKGSQMVHGAKVSANLGRGSQASIDPAATSRGRPPSRLPGVLQTLVVDTASDVPWVQCVPCPVPPCHPQTDTVFDPTRSGSYAPIACGSPACRQLGPYANGCVNNQCQYRVAYPDGSSSSGTYSTDLLTFTPTFAVRGFQFGCSHSEQGSGSFDPTTAGILALGRGPESLVSQTKATYGSVFSYCNPPTASYVGFFVLGAPNRVASRYVVTPLRSYPLAPTFYRVQLQAITVNGQRLAGVPPAVLAPGTVLDSRTAVTRLPPTAYQALRAAFRSAMAMYRSAPPQGSLDTCYDFTGVVTIRLPRITLVFDRNAVVELDPSGILFHDCLAFIPNANDLQPAILGNVQQQTIEVLYDIDGAAVGFRGNAC